MESQMNLEKLKPKKSKRQAQKVRVKLPGIESYEKELEFTAEGPGRVIVRLERLMGSDKIRITDPKYLSTLVERLEAEEAESWVTRSRLRKKAEKNRSRQLAIEGLMEPAEDMQDLWNHPVFRVNRILNRLNAFDYNMSHMGGDMDKLPGITEVEPFSDDQTGAVFKTYPGHNIFYQNDLPYSSRVSVKASRSRVDQKISTTEIMKASQSKVEVSTKPSETEVADTPEASKVSMLAERLEEEAGKEGEGEEGDEEEEGSEMAPKVKTREQLDLEAKVSLEDFRQLYGVPSDEDLVGHWQPFRSDLVNMVYTDDGTKTADTIYETSNQVVDVYLRQQFVMEEYVSAHKPDAVLQEPDSQETLANEEEEEEEEGTEEEDEEGSYFEDEQEEGQIEDETFGEIEIKIDKAEDAVEGGEAEIAVDEEPDEDKDEETDQPEE